jgi:hypothetical protein
MQKSVGWLELPVLQSSKYVHIHMYMYIFMYTRIYIYIYMYVYVYVYVCIFSVHTYTPPSAPSGRYLASAREVGAQTCRPCTWYTKRKPEQQHSSAPTSISWLISAKVHKHQLCVLKPTLIITTISSTQQYSNQQANHVTGHNMALHDRKPEPKHYWQNEYGDARTQSCKLSTRYARTCT